MLQSKFFFVKSGKMQLYENSNDHFKNNISYNFQHLTTWMWGVVDNDDGSRRSDNGGWYPDAFVTLD